MARWTLKVEGMTCTGCESRVQKSLSQLKGVTDVKADHEQDRVIVEVSPVASEEELRERIEFLGYRVAS